MAGFTPLGGLEIDERYLKMFQENHESTKYTILSDLKHVTQNDYPSNVHTLLAGIPCTFESKGNKKLNEALKRIEIGLGTEEDQLEVEKRYEIHYLTYYVIEAIRAMNPKTVVIEEVIKYSKTDAANMLRGILKHMGYTISETIDQGTTASRDRWCLVANMGKKIELENIVPKSNETIEQFLEIPLDKREWKDKKDMPRLVRADEANNVGIRAIYPHDTKCKVFTTHGTRATEPILSYKGKYSEFTNQEIANIHKLTGYKLSGVKTLDRQVLGQGTVDMFYYVAKQIIRTNSVNYENSFDLIA